MQSPLVVPVQKSKKKLKIIIGSVVGAVASKTATA